MSPCIRFFVEVLIAFQRALIFGVLHARRFGTSWGEVYWGSGTNNITSATSLARLYCPKPHIHWRAPMCH